MNRFTRVILTDMHSKLEIDIWRNANNKGNDKFIYVIRVY